MNNVIFHPPGNGRVLTPQGFRIRLCLERHILKEEATLKLER